MSASLAFYEIPLSATPQTMQVQLNGITYTLTFTYRMSPDGDGGWIMDIADASGNNLVCGRPLVTGADILGQFRYLGIGGSMAIGTDGNPWAVPGFNDLGVISHLYFIPYPSGT